MSKFIESEIYGNCDVNNNSTANGKVYNDDILYVSFSQETFAPEDVELTIHVRRFDGTKTKSGVPLVHFWIAEEGSDATSNQQPFPIDEAPFGTVVAVTTDGYILDPPGAIPDTIDSEGTELYTGITNSTTHDIVISLTSDSDDISVTRYLNAMVQGIVYSEKFDIAFAA